MIEHREQRRDERGAVLAFFGISLTALLLIAALVLDGGQAYTQRRQMQNAADAAAMAGARALDRHRFGGAGATAISAEVNSVATRNGADSVTSCRLLNFDGTDLGACTSSAAAAAAESVAVEVADVRDTTFGQLAGVESVTVTASATAQIQGVAAVDTPFIICGNAALGGYPLLNDDGSVNHANAIAAGIMDIHGSQVPTCNAGSQFKGLNDNGPIHINRYHDPGTQGRRVGQYRGVEAGAVPCPAEGPFDNCDMLIPIAAGGRPGGSNAELYITAFAVFRVTGIDTGNVSHRAQYLGQVDVLPGGMGSAVDFANPSNIATLRIVKLVA